MDTIPNDGSFVYDFYVGCMTCKEKRVVFLTELVALCRQHDAIFSANFDDIESSSGFAHFEGKPDDSGFSWVVSIADLERALREGT